MQRKAVRLVGLVLAGAAAFSVLRRLLRRSGGGDEAGPPPAPLTLTSVPDLEPEPVVPVPEPEPFPGPAPLAAVSVEESTPDDPSWMPPVGEACPAGYPIKVNERSGIYHVPGGLSYDRTRPTRCYPNEDAAEADGFRRAKR